MELKSIHQIFQQSIFRIPSYQRGYTWKNNKLINRQNTSIKEKLHDINGQLIDLWKDIVNIQSNKWHYTGLLTMVKSKNKDYNWLNNYEQFDIVDGQQRITTILIILSLLLEKANNYNIEIGLRDGDTQMQYLCIKKNGLLASIFGYDKDNPSDKYFRKHILGLEEIEDESKESSYTENLINAKNFFEILIESYIRNKFNTAEEGIKDLFDRITNRLKFNVYILHADLDEYVVFETMNNRGKSISDLEKLKNRLMYLADKIEHYDDVKFFDLPIFDNKDQTLALRENLKDDINTAWITIYQELGTNKKDPLDDEEYIKNHWIMYFNNYSREESKVYSNFLFNEYFTIENVYNNKIDSAIIRKYVKSLQESSIVWNKIHHPEFFSIEEEHIKPYIYALHRVGFRASFKPLLLACFSKKNYDNTFLEILRQLEKFAFKTFYISDRKSNAGDSKLYSLAAEIFEGKSLSSIYNELSILTKNFYDFNLFKLQIKKLFLEGEAQGFYNWSGLNYFLYMYDEYLRRKNHISSIDSKMNWEDVRQKKSIEHIFPQSAVNNAVYSKVNENWEEFKDYNVEQKKRLCNSLGNLLLLSKSDNASFKNDAFVHKIDQSIKGDNYKNRGYRFNSFIAQMVAKEPEWTAQSILKRGLDMLDFLVELLEDRSIDLSKREKTEILGLDSVF
jgi:uncharacterized protein with ParB-like and HNH nuclease domain